MRRALTRALKLAFRQIIIQRACFPGASDAHFLLLASLSLSVRHLTFICFSFPFRHPRDTPSLEAPPPPDPSARATPSAYAAPPPITTGALRRHLTQLVRACHPQLRGGGGLVRVWGFVSWHQIPPPLLARSVESSDASGQGVRRLAAALCSPLERGAVAAPSRPLLCSAALFLDSYVDGRQPGQRPAGGRLLATACPWGLGADVCCPAPGS